MGISSGLDPRFTVDRMEADVTVNNSTTLVDATDMTFWAQASVHYIMEIYGRINCSAAGDLKAQITSTSGTATGMVQFQTDTAGTVDANIGSPATIVTAGSPESFQAWVDVDAGATAGNVKLQFAQAVADVSDCKFLEGTMMRVTRVD